MEIKLGCDPEVFMADLSGALKSAVGRIGGTKHAPQPLPIGEGFCVQEDNVAMEFNIPPASGAQEYVSHIRTALNFLSEGIKQQYQYQIVPISAASWPASELQSREAQTFGCDPDYNVWTGEKNPRPAAVDHNLRSCGGHIHVGYDTKLIKGEQLIKMMDLYLGVPSVLMDKGDLRKELYGKAGAYRTKKYGVEYRTLSNFWIFKDSLIEWVWKNTERAVAAVEAQFPIEEYRTHILNAIDNNDKRVAESLCKQLNIETVYV